MSQLNVNGLLYPESFQNFLVTFDEFCRDPSGLFTNPKLVVRVEGKYYSWQVAAPMIMSAVVFLQVLPMDTQKKLVNKHMPKKVGHIDPRETNYMYMHLLLKTRHFVALFFA